MSLSLIMAQDEDLELLLEFEKRKLAEAIVDPIDAQFAMWQSRGRRESFTHYLSAGCSFMAFDSESQASPRGELVGYFLAQPLLFFEGLTQSLWIEHIQFSTLQARDELCDLGYRIARDRHFQAVYFPNSPQLSLVLKSLKSEEWNPKVVIINTTRRG